MKIIYGTTKYRRLIWMVFELVLFSSVVWFVSEYLWDFGFSRAGFSKRQIVTHSVNALEGGVAAGLLVGFLMWLAVESVRKRTQL